MKIHDKMHPAQVAILHALLFRPSAGFAELQKASTLESDHFNFHLKEMLKQELVSKNADNHYELTVAGKEYANRFDTDNRVVERQPKVAVLLIVEKQDGRFLFQQRLKQPYYGFWGRPTGKLRWGETILEGAARELLEETGLTAELTLKEVHHKMDYNEDTKELFEDKIFFIVHGVHPQGELIEEFDGGRNAWFSDDEVYKLEKAFSGLTPYDTIRSKELRFTEKSFFYSQKDY